MVPVVLNEVQTYIKENVNTDISFTRIEHCYDLIESSSLKVNTTNKKYLSKEDEELEYILDEITIILQSQSLGFFETHDEEIEKAINKVYTVFEQSKIEYIPRLAFYILVIDELIPMFY